MALFLSLAAFVSLVLAASQIEQHFFRRRAELLLSEFHSLELRKTPWQEARTRFQHWGKDLVADEKCSEQKCSFRIMLEEGVYRYVTQRNIFQKSDDYLRWKFKLSPDFRKFENFADRLRQVYVRVGGRPARVTAFVGMRNGIVWQQAFTVEIDTPEKGDPAWFDYLLFAFADSVPRFAYHSNSIDQQSLRHPNYVIGRPGGCEGCVAGWIKFSPYADPGDIRRLTKFDLSCLTRWHPCVAQEDIMPAAWRQYVAEGEASDSMGCPSFLAEIIGRDSANIATGQVLSYSETPDSFGYERLAVKIRVLERFKGLGSWQVGEIRTVPVSTDSGDPKPRTQAGSRIFLFAGEGRVHQMRMDPGYGCPVLFLNPSNVAQVRRGIEEDYSATNPTN